LAQLTPDPEQGLRMLEQLQQTAGDSALLRLNQADKIQAIGGPEMATRLKALESHSFTSTEEITTLYQGIAAVYRRAGMYEDSLRLWRELLKMHPKNLALRVVSFDVAYEASDFDAMNEMVAEIAKVEGQRSSEWQVAEARRQLWMYHNDRGDKGQLADIMRLLQQAQSARPDFAPLYMVKAEVQLANNEPDAAVDSMKTALDKRPGEVAYLQRLADVLRSLNRDTEAQKYLAQLPEQHKRAQDMVTEIRMLLAKDPAKAVETAEKLFPPTSDDQTTLMYLVEVYEAAKAMDKGLPILQRAIQLKPSEPRPWLVYVRTLVNQGKTDEAKRAIEKMKSRLETENPALWLGQCYATVGELALAEASYDEAVQREPNNTVLLRNQALLFLATGQTEKLFACLRQLMAIDTASDEQTQVDVAWARRTLAQQLGSTGRYQDFLEALKTLEPNGNEGSTLSGEDLLLWLRLCANRSEAPSRNKALTRLNQIRDERELISAESAILAYLYYVDGRWTDAKRVMLDLLATNPNNMGFVTTYIEWLIERGDDADATAWIRKLNPQSVEAIRFSSILLTKQGKAPDVARRLMALVPKQIDELTVVRIMEELGKHDERFYEQARRQWASMVKKKPEMIHAYISYLTRMPEGKGLEQALSLSQAQLQQAIKDERPDVAGFYLDLGIKALRTHRKVLKADSPHFERVHGWFDLARQAKVDELTLAWSEVDYFDVRRDYGRLETLYAELLKRHDLGSQQEAVVRNNLAFIYAISDKGDQALDVIGDAITQLGPRSDLLDTRGLAYLARGDFDRAVEDLRLAVADGRADASMYFHLALAELRKGNRDEAQSAFKTATEMGLDQADLSLPERQLYQKLESQLKENELSQAR
jgi:tetratricopeptide (TPR) repeat protein